MKNQKGFTIVEVLLVILVIAVIGFGGYSVWNNQEDDPTTETTQDTSQAETDTDSVVKEEVAEENNTPEGWVLVTDSESGISYYADPAWSDETSVDVFEVSEEVPFGYGAPVSLKFNTSSQTWEEYGAGEKRDNSNTVTSTTQVAGDLPTAIIHTGDGGAGEKRIVFVSGDSIIQISMPSAQNYDEYPYDSEIDDLIGTVTVR